MDFNTIKSSAILCLLFMVKGGLSQTFTIAPATATLNENSAAGATVATMTATGNTGAVTYALTSNEFEVSSADIVVKSGGVVLDFEGATKIYTLAVSATDSTGGTPKSASVNLVVTLADVNDNMPTYAMTSVVKYAAPGMGQGTVGNYTPTDADSGTNANIAGYSIASGNTDTTFTYVDGIVAVASGKTLATSTPCYALVLQANDGGNPSMTGSMTLQVVVGYSTQTQADNGVPGLQAGLLTLVAMVLVMVLTWNKQI